MHLVERHLPVGSLSDLSALRTRLLRFAWSRLRNAVLAEDAVSETLLAALETPRSFDTPTEALAWLYGVLRHKLVDQLRQQEREMPAGDRLLEAGAEADGGLMAGGGWAGGAGPADAPDEIVSQRELLAVVLQCCDLLPRLQGRAFLLRELRGLEPDAIWGALKKREFPYVKLLTHRDGGQSVGLPINQACGADLTPPRRLP